MHKRPRSSTHTLGQLLREARKAQRLTHRAVAKAAEVSHGFIADLEAGRRNASDDVLSRIANAVGIAPAVAIRAATNERLERLKERADELRRELR